MAKKPKAVVNPAASAGGASTAPNVLQAALDAARISGTVEHVVMDADYLRCTISGVYDAIQRQGRSDDDLIALAVASYTKHVERRDA